MKIHGNKGKKRPAYRIKGRYVIKRDEARKILEKLKNDLPRQQTQHP